MPFEKSFNEESEAIVLLKARLSGFETEEGRLKGLSYTPKLPNEVAISTSPKAGTTWLQQVSFELFTKRQNGNQLSFNLTPTNLSSLSHGTNTLSPPPLPFCI